MSNAENVGKILKFKVIIKTSKSDSVLITDNKRRPLLEVFNRDGFKLNIGRDGMGIFRGSVSLAYLRFRKVAN